MKALSPGRLEADGAVVATGGVLFHYHPPYGDVHMDVREAFRRQGGAPSSSRT